MNVDKLLEALERHCSTDIKDKIGGTRFYVAQMLNRTNRIFKYTGLPDTIPAKNLELLLQVNGFACFGQDNAGDWYALYGGLGGEPDAYLMPTICTVANPALKLNRMYKIGKDCAIVRNDPLGEGLLPMYSRYATMIAENDVTIRQADINARMIALISAPDDATKAAAEEYLRQIERGENGVIADNAFLEGIRAQPYAASGSTNNITQLIELQQYLKASWMNDVGLSANYNMKREAINSQEAQIGDDALLPLVDAMLEARREGLEVFNRISGYHVTVEKAGAWMDRQQDADEASGKNTDPQDEGGDGNEAPLD